MIRRDQKGLAAIVISLVLVTLLSAVAISFAVLMNREAHKSLNNQLGQAAYDAAASGINDAISYIRDNPATDVTQCQDLIGSGKPLNAAADLSGNGNTKYTCALINTKPHDLSYQSINSYQSQVIRLSVAGPTGGGDIMTKMMLSWQATNRSYASFVPSPQAGQLFDETTWNNSRFAPLMRVAIYPVPADTKDLTYATNNSSTYFFYPVNAPVGSSVTNLPLSTASGSLQNINCGGGAKNTGGFSGSADYDCNVILTGLPTSDVNGYQYFVRLTPYYSNADAKIKGNDASAQPISFVGTQAVVDVTAQSSSAVKRLQARVDISRLNGNSQDIAPSDNAIPEFALRQPNTICKRLQVPPANSSPVTIDAGSVANCPFSFASSAPSVSLTASPPTVTPGGSSTLTWTSTNATTCNGAPWTSSTAANSSQSVTPAATTTYTLTCSGPGGSGQDSATVTVNQPPPPPPSANNAANANGGGDIVCTIYDPIKLFGDCTNSRTGGVWNVTDLGGGCYLVTLSDVSYRGYASDSRKVCTKPDALPTDCPAGFSRDAKTGLCGNTPGACTGIYSNWFSFPDAAGSCVGVSGDPNNPNGKACAQIIGANGLPQSGSPGKCHDSTYVFVPPGEIVTPPPDCDAVCRALNNPPRPPPPPIVPVPSGYCSTCYQVVIPGGPVLYLN